MAERKKYSVTCTDCGIATEVPFEPKPGRAVYCKECFPKHRASKNTPDTKTDDISDDTLKNEDVSCDAMLKQFGYWQKMMSESYLQSMKFYEDMMNKFGENWKKMFEKS